MKTLLLDTDVLVDYLRAFPVATQFLKSQEAPLAMSAITVAELYAGVREGREKEALDSFIEAFEVFPVTEIVARQGGLWRRDFGKSHGVGLADAMIAATAQDSGAILVTLNRRHFPMLSDVQIPYSKT
jgi:predicted nucleic acid-binding protein